MGVQSCVITYVPAMFGEFKRYHVRSEVFTAVRMMMLFFWLWAPCRLVGRCQRFGETSPLQPSRWRE
jgi:hypothetical protein